MQSEGLTEKHPFTAAVRGEMANRSRPERSGSRENGSQCSVYSGHCLGHFGPK